MIKLFPTEMYNGKFPVCELCFTKDQLTTDGNGRVTCDSCEEAVDTLTVSHKLYRAYEQWARDEIELNYKDENNVLTDRLGWINQQVTKSWYVHLNLLQHQQYQ